MHDQVYSWIRTGVPMLVGFLTIWLSNNFGIVVDSEDVTFFSSALVGIVSLVYYIVFRVLAMRWPKLEWFLGIPSKPVYEKKTKSNQTKKGW